MKRWAGLLFMLLFIAGPAWAGGGRATVASIEIVIAVSFPVQVFAILRGHLNDGCTKIAGITSRGPEDNRFDIEITTQRPSDMMCTQALVPFQHNVPIQAYGLLAGDYEVVAGEARASFTLRQDNKLP